MTTTTPPQVRVAIYTRKSTDEGLEQEFNSLDAQREAALAYIANRRHLGWMPSRMLMTTGDSPAATWSARRSNGCSGISPAGRLIA